MLVEEVLSRWEPVDGIAFSFISAEIHIAYPLVSVRLIDGRLGVAAHRDLIFSFCGVKAFTLYEEFVHPEQGTVWGRPPTISDEKHDTFPCLRVVGSPWYASIQVELDIIDKGPVHYRLCTSYPVLDVVSAEEPRVLWHERPLAAQDAEKPTWAIE